MIVLCHVSVVLIDKKLKTRIFLCMFPDFFTDNNTVAAKSGNPMKHNFTLYSKRWQLDIRRSSFFQKGKYTF